MVDGSLSQGRYRLKRRIASGGMGTAGGSNGGQGSNEGSRNGEGVDTATLPASAPTATVSPTGILISDSFIGADSDEVEQLLTAPGVSVDTTRQDSEVPAGTVLGVEPPPGTTVAEGDTVTLAASTGTTGEEDDDDHGDYG